MDVRECGHLRRFTLEDYDLCLYCEVAKLRADLARARAVLDGSYDAGPSESGKTHTLIVDAAAWRAWREGQK